MPDLSEPYTLPFTVLIDTAEQFPFGFQGYRCDADKNYRPMVVPTRFESLGRHPNQNGDYSIDGFVGKIAIERKSSSDIVSTVLGWPTENEQYAGLESHRERFEHELSRMEAMQFSIVIVESSMDTILKTMPAPGSKTSAENAKIFSRSIVSYQQRFRVPWMFLPDRCLAEQYALAFLRRAHRKYSEWLKEAKNAKI